MKESCLYAHGIMDSPCDRRAVVFDATRELEDVSFNLNPDLKDLTARLITDESVAEADERGLRIMLDRCRPDTESQPRLWYIEAVSKENGLVM